MTKEEEVWIAKLVEHGCYVCHIQGYGYSPPAIHHILNGGRRIDHLHTLPLCPYHHQGGSKEVSRHPSKRDFEAAYGLELDMLEDLRLK